MMPKNMFPGQPAANAPETTEAHAALATARETLNSIVIGKTHAVKLALATLLAGGHLLLEDLPGVGKTTLAHALAATLGMQWGRVQFTSDLLPADITGLSVYDPTNGTFEFHRGPVFTSLLLADEINRAPAKTQSALLEAMAEQQVTVDGIRYKLPAPFFVVATQNPTEQLGVFPLPESQLDRFLACVELGYPDKASERTLLTGTDRQDLIADIAPVMTPESVLYWQAKARQIHAADPLIDYLQSLLQTSRNYALAGKCANGLSPRAGVYLLRLCRAWALLNDASMVLPEHVQSVFCNVAAHRIAGSLSAGSPIAKEILDSVDVV